MKRIFSISLFVIAFGVALLPNLSFAQGMMGYWGSTLNSSVVQDQEQEEQEGKQFLDGLSNKTTSCAQLQDADFEMIGEYFMGQSIGDTTRHIAMNERMKSMIGEQGEEQMHIAWGKRGSACDTSAVFPPESIGFMPMMLGGWSSPTDINQGSYSMMNFGFAPFGGFGWLFMLIFWGLVILAIIAVVRYGLGKGRMYGGYAKSPLEILQERYAKGEIDKKEFDVRKKDLV